MGPVSRSPLGLTSVCVMVFKHNRRHVHKNRQGVGSGVAEWEGVGWGWGEGGVGGKKAGALVCTSSEPDNKVQPRV